MKLSTRARYGSRALTELALVYPDGTLSIRNMAEKQQVSPKYLAQIMRALKTSGLVTSVRGMHGGFALARKPEDVTLKEVYKVLEGTFAPVECVDNPESCTMQESCPTRDTWVEMMQAMESVLERTTMQDLADRAKSKSKSIAAMYHI